MARMPTIRPGSSGNSLVDTAQSFGIENELDVAARVSGFLGNKGGGISVILDALSSDQKADELAELLAHNPYIVEACGGKSTATITAQIDRTNPTFKDERAQKKDFVNRLGIGAAGLAGSIALAGMTGNMFLGLALGAGGGYLGDLAYRNATNSIDETNKTGALVALSQLREMGGQDDDTIATLMLLSRTSPRVQKEAERILGKTLEDAMGEHLQHVVSSNGQHTHSVITETLLGLQNAPHIDALIRSDLQQRDGFDASFIGNSVTLAQGLRMHGVSAEAMAVGSYDFLLSKVDAAQDTSMIAASGFVPTPGLPPVPTLPTAQRSV